MKDHSFLLSDKKNGWRGVTPSSWNFGANWPCWSEIDDFQSVFARRLSRHTYRSPLYALSNEPKMNIVRYP